MEQTFLRSGQVNLGGGRRPNLFEECQGRDGYFDIENKHPWNLMHGEGVDIFKIHPWNVPSPVGTAPRAVQQAELVTDGLLAIEGLQLLHKQGKRLLMELKMSLLCFLLEVYWLSLNCLQVIDTNPNAHKGAKIRFHAF